MKVHGMPIRLYHFINYGYLFSFSLLGALAFLIISKYFLLLPFFTQT